jgi:hypothetical protein
MREIPARQVHQVAAATRIKPQGTSASHMHRKRDLPALVAAAQVAKALAAQVSNAVPPRDGLHADAELLGGAPHHQRLGPPHWSGLLPRQLLRA